MQKFTARTLAVVLATFTLQTNARPAASFNVVEASIEDMQAAMAGGEMLVTI